MRFIDRRACDKPATEVWDGHCYTFHAQAATGLQLTGGGNDPGSTPPLAQMRLQPFDSEPRSTGLERSTWGEIR